MILKSWFQFGDAAEKRKHLYRNRMYVAIRSRDIRRGSAGEENAFLAELTADWERPFTASIC